METKIYPEDSKIGDIESGTTLSANKLRKLQQKNNEQAIITKGLQYSKIFEL